MDSRINNPRKFDDRIFDFEFNRIYLRTSIDHEAYIDLLFCKHGDLTDYLFFDGVQFHFISKGGNVDLMKFEDVTTDLLKGTEGKLQKIDRIESDFIDNYEIHIEQGRKLIISLSQGIDEEVYQQIWTDS